MLNDHQRNRDWIAAARRWKELVSQRGAIIQKLQRGEVADSRERHVAAARRAKVFAPIAAQENLAARQAGVSDFLGAGAAERVIRTADFEPPAFLELGLAVSRAVCLVVVRDRWGGTLATGTGFLVAPGVVLTNHHVIMSFDEAATTQLTFDFRTDPQGRDLPTTVFALDPGRLFITDPDRDCSFIAVGARVSGTRSIGDYPWLPLTGRTGKLEIGDPVYIIQHPSGERMKFVLRENKLLLLPNLAGLKDPNVYAHYEADTLQGSSGAPVCSRFWEVVALHHQAVPDVDEKGQVLDLDGKPYFGSDDSRVRWLGNEGVRVTALIRLLEQARTPLTGNAAELVDAILQSERPDYVELARRALPPTTVLTSHTSESAFVSTSATNAIELTIPLRITIGVGTPTNAAPPTLAAVASSIASAAADGPPSVAPVPTLPRAPGTPPAPLSPELQQSKDEAFAELEASRRRRYYDGERDARDRETFYEGFALGDNPSENFQQLSELLASSHATKPRYAPSKHLYPWIDLYEHNGSLVIKSIYSGQVFDADEFLEEAFRIEARREALRRTMRLNESLAVVPESALEELLEANAPYNCEHVVPQSWFSKREPMRGDLHHLFACESGCNSFRGNHAYDQFALDEAVRDKCGRRETHRFEPASGKGAVARATLYFLLRYPRSIDMAISQMDTVRIAQLVAWHEGDPVSVHERHRNQGIFAVQGNRNPLIDFPAWAGSIDWSAGLSG